MDPASTAASIYYNGPTSLYSLQQVVGKPSMVIGLDHIKLSKALVEQIKGAHLQEQPQHKAGQPHMPWAFMGCFVCHFSF